MVFCGIFVGLEKLYKGCSLNLIYCDVKISNIFIIFKYDGKLIDFGLWRFFGIIINECDFFRVELMNWSSFEVCFNCLGFGKFGVREY